MSLRPVVGVSTKHTCVSKQANVAYAQVFGEDTNHGAGQLITDNQSQNYAKKFF
jgi:hypothetical protein